MIYERFGMVRYVNVKYTIFEYKHLYIWCLKFPVKYAYFSKVWTFS